MCEDSFGTTFRIPVVSASITVQRAINTCVFETMPVETLPDVFFENHLSFPIINGYHQGNVQNQNATDPAIIDTGFFNCFTFGNGTESYKINDSIVGNTFNLGERVTSVSAQDYKAADRFADITYSGVYNTESNVNKLNEFNLGLLNYKYLEVSFGEIFVLDGRQTDVLVLQEDRVSYVLAGKNLLSDAAAGGAITSVPEVLGTQIARTEKYGVSFNPESYVQWGYDRYFTDAKRGAVLQIRGDSYQSDQLKVVSEQGMRTWFRDMFNSSFNTQKLGGFDPYMNEYVLSPNDTLLPITQECLPCGTIQTFNISQKSKDPEEVKYCVDLTEVIGEVVIEYNVTSIDGTFAMYATYNASSVATPSIDSVGSGTLDFYKDTNYIENADITITVTGNVVVTIKVNCPVPQPMNVIEIVVTANYQATQMIHAEYRYTNGLYTSPQQSNLVTLVSGTNNPLVSRYQVNSGYTGNAGFPPPGSNMTIRTNKISPDNFNFDPTKNKLRYLRSSTLYSNTPVDVQSAIDASTIVPLIVSGPNIYSGDFYVPSDTLGENLYLIWDLRCSTSTEMCYYEEGEEFVLKDICCNCFTCLGISPCVSYKVKNLGMVDLVVSFPSGTCGSLEPYILTVPVEGQESICVNNGSYTITEGYGQITQVSCNCECTEICWQWVITVPNGSAVVRYDECFGVSTLVTVVEDHPVTICAKIDTEPVVVAGTAELSLDMSCGCGL
jgi:hypothetical protein